MIFKIIKKLISVLGTAFLVGALCYSILYYSPGNTAVLMLSKGEPGAVYNKQAVIKFAETFGLDQSLPVQLKNWMGKVLHGDFGISYKTGVSVLEEFMTRFKCTFSLMLFAVVVMVILGVTLGILSAMYNNRLLDKIVRMFVVFHISIPSFWMALLFLWFFAMKLKWFPSFGFRGFSSLILPGAVLGIGRSCSVIRITKSCMTEHMGSLYAMTARAKGMKEITVLVKHVLKNIALPIITMCSMQIISLMGGSVVIESIFGLPGIGNYLITAIKYKDMPVVAGFVFLIALLTILINLITELLYLLVDPRVRISVHEQKK